MFWKKILFIFNPVAGMSRIRDSLLDIIRPEGLSGSARMNISISAVPAVTAPWTKSFPA